LSTNLVNYLKVELHADSKSAANSVTNWVGTSAITPLAAAFLADSFLGRYWTITLFLVISVAVRICARSSTSMTVVAPAKTTTEYGHARAAVDHLYHAAMFNLDRGMGW
jgi:peptide/histidine transporter 3/4